MVDAFTQHQIDAFRVYCEERLGDQVARMHVAVRDHGFCLGCAIETFDGQRFAVAATPNGDRDDDAAARVVTALEDWMKARQLQ